MPDPLDSQALLPRPQLIDSLRRGLAGRATLLVAPAGYGKTTVVSEFAASLDVPVIWCIFKPKDAGARPFVRRILQAIESELSGAVSETSETAFGNVKPRQRLRAALAELAEMSCSTYCILVLEDYHYIGASNEVNELTSELLEELPSEIHLIITSRVWPEIRQLPKLVSQRRISVLETRDLAFSQEEVTAFLRLATGSPSSDSEVRELFEATRGWPACIVLLGANRIPGRAVILKGPELYTYFMAEILGILPARMARFMLETSVLPVITPSYCNELIGRLNAAVLIERLRARHLLQPSTGHRDAYEYHPLMRDFLLSRLRASSPQRYEELHLHAADLFSRHRRWQEAVDLLASVEAWSQLANLLEVIIPRLVHEGMWGVLTEWIDCLPEDVLLARDQLVLLRGKLAYLQRDPSTALRLLGSAQRLLALPKGIVIKAAALSLQGSNIEAITLARRALDLAKKAGDVDAASNAQLWLGIARSVKGSYASAERSLRSALRYFVSVGEIYGQAVCYAHLAGICHFQARVDEETVLLESAERIWRKLGNREHLARTLNNLGVSQHQRGNYDAALSAFTQCLKLARRLGTRMEEAYCLTGLADVLRDRSMLQRARIFYRRAAELTNELGEGLLYVYLLAGQAELKRLEGEVDEAEALAKQALSHAVEHRNPQEEGICLAVLGTVYRDQQKFADCTAVLERACQLLDGAGSKVEAAKAHFLMATALFRARQRSRALHRLETVSDIVGTIGHDQFILPLADREQPLIQYALAKSCRSDPMYQWATRLATHTSRCANGTMPSPDTPKVEVRTLGDFLVLVNDVPVTDLAWQTTKAKEMFVHLAVKQRPVLKDEVIEALWPDLPSEKCSSYFHSTLNRVRRALYRHSVVRDGPRYLLNPEGVFNTDASDFLNSVKACRVDEPSIDSLRQAIARYVGPFAPEIYSDWAVAFRSQLENQYLWTLDSLLRRVLSSKMSAEIATLCQKMLDVDPFHEVAWRELIRYHQHGGHLGLALRLYRQCTDVFVNQLGTEVPPEIASLMQPA